MDEPHGGYRGQESPQQMGVGFCLKAGSEWQGGSIGQCKPHSAQPQGTAGLLSASTGLGVAGDACLFRHRAGASAVSF